MEVENKRFSIEDIFNFVEMKHHAIGITFTPGSTSYIKYKDGITLTRIINFTLEEILYNIQQKMFTYGVIQGKGYSNRPSINADVILLEFSTKDIEYIECLNI